MELNCKYCKFSTILKNNFNRHLKTKKHIKTINTYEATYSKYTDMNQNEPKMNQNEPKMNQNEPIMNQHPIKKFICDHCKESFKTKPSMRRHQLHRCKNHNEASINTNNNIEKNLLEKKHEREKKQMYK